MTTPQHPPRRRNPHRRGITWFLLIAFAWAWIAGLVAHLAGLSLDDPVAQTLTFAFTPAIAAVIVRLVVTREGFADAGLRPRLRQSWRHYLAALAVPVGTLILGAVTAAATGLWHPGPAAISTDSLSSLAIAPLFALLMAPLFLGEEFGWTSYLRDRLLPGRPVATTFVTGAIWGVWHFPLPWLGYFGAGTDPLDAFWAMLLWLPLSIMLEFLIGWLWSATGSVWPGVLLHSANNLVASVGLRELFDGQLSETTESLVFLTALLPFVLAVVLTGHTGRGPRRPCDPADECSHDDLPMAAVPALR